MLTQLLAAATQKRDQVLDRRWKVKIRGTEIVLRDVAEQVIKAVQKFKAVGDVIAQYDPVMLSPPWAAVRFLLQVIKIHPWISGGTDVSVAWHR